MVGDDSLRGSQSESTNRSQLSRELSSSAPSPVDISAESQTRRWSLLREGCASRLAHSTLGCSNELPPRGLPDDDRGSPNRIRCHRRQSAAQCFHFASSHSFSILRFKRGAWQFYQTNVYTSRLELKSTDFR